MEALSVLLSGNGANAGWFVLKIYNLEIMKYSYFDLVAII